MYSLVFSWKLIVDNKDNIQRWQNYLYGVLFLHFPLITPIGCPINKKILSHLCSVTTRLPHLVGASDMDHCINKKEKWSRFFHAFGVNPLIVYVFAGVFATLVGAIRFAWQGETISVKSFTYSVLLQPWAGNYFGSLLYAVLFVTICWLFGYILYKRNIYIKL